MTTETPRDDKHNNIRFGLNGEIVEVDDIDPTQTVLQYLRAAGLTGTKEGCAEGDCGACTAALFDIDDAGDGVTVRAINTCIQFVPTLDGRSLVTVEGVDGSDGELHPVQRAMVDAHASQCGFCTPGFVMSLYAMLQATEDLPNRRQIDDGLSGNLCRCTGYRPIVDAAQRAASEMKSGEYQSQTKKKIAARQRSLLMSVKRSSRLSIGHRGRAIDSPRSVEDLETLIDQHPNAILLSGGTDVGLWVTKQHRQLDRIIYTGNVAELRSIQKTDKTIHIGAAVTLSQAMPVILNEYPELEELFVRFASTPIRNAATLGGNIANGSPIGDSMPALIAIGTKLVLRSRAGRRRIDLDEFYIGYQHTALEPGEFIESIEIEANEKDAIVRSYKVSKRFDQDISGVCFAARLELIGDRVESIRMAFGGVAAIVTRPKLCETILTGSIWGEDNLSTAMRVLEQELTPISDMRATADYRTQLCKSLLFRFVLDSTNQPTTSVYAYGR